jgi:hypothetical protein
LRNRSTSTPTAITLVTPLGLDSNPISSANGGPYCGHRSCRPPERTPCAWLLSLDAALCVGELSPAILQLEVAGHEVSRGSSACHASAVHRGKPSAASLFAGTVPDADLAAERLRVTSFLGSDSRSTGNVKGGSPILTKRATSCASCGRMATSPSWGPRRWSSSA